MGVTRGLQRSLAVNRNAIATIFKDRTRTWAEFADRVARLACGLQDLGARRNDRIAILMANSDRYLECYASIPWANCLIVPLNTRWSEQELAYTFDDCTPAILIVDDAMADLGAKAAKAAKRQPKLVLATDAPTAARRRVAEIRVTADYEQLISQSSPIPDSGRCGKDLAGIFYTGGTTGRSKGVMLTHEGVTSNAAAMLGEGLFPERTRFLHAAPMFHMADGLACFSLLMSGGASVVAETFDPGAVLAMIEQQRVSEALFVPTMIQMLLAHPDVRVRDISSLERVIYGASPISEAVLNQAQEVFSATKFIQAYGMTELSPVACILHAEHLSGEGRAKGRHRSAGRASFSIEIKIIDEKGRPAPPRQVGEIVVRSPGVMAGYWRREKDTKAALRDGWMHTGDGGFMDEDGFVYVVDRIKDMIVTGGENVFSAEVENVIAQLPEVAQVAVIGVPSQQWGEQVHAIVALKNGKSISSEDVMQHCRNTIAGYKCPRGVEFLDALPLTGAGKINKPVLRAPHWQGQARGVN